MKDKGGLSQYTHPTATSELGKYNYSLQRAHGLLHSHKFCHHPSTVTDPVLNDNHPQITAIINISATSTCSYGATVAMQFADKWCTVPLFKGYASYVICLLSPLQTKGGSTAKERYRNHNIRWIRMVSELNGRVHKTKEHGSKPIKVKFWNWHTLQLRVDSTVIKYGIPR